MNLIWKFVVCVVATLTFAIMYQMAAKGSATAYAQSYYVDSVSGNDSNNGTASTSPWKTLGKVNATSFAPGDTVFFKAGSTFFGYLAPATSGNSSASIRFDMYGSGAKPVIDASGVADPIGGEGAAAVQIYGKEYLEFTNLEVTNNPVIDTTLGRVPDNKDSYRLGFLIANGNIGRTLNHIVIKDCVVRDISRNIPYQRLLLAAAEQEYFKGRVIQESWRYVHTARVEGVHHHRRNLVLLKASHERFFLAGLCERPIIHGHHRLDYRVGQDWTKDCKRNGAVRRSRCWTQRMSRG